MRANQFGISADFAAGGNPQLRGYLLELERQVADLQGSVGTTSNQAKTPAPMPSSWKVTGQDGQFIIDITLPQAAVAQTPVQARRWGNDPELDFNPTFTGIYHQLQSSTNIQFDAAGGVTTYGGDSGDARTHYEIPDPHVTKFWRFRSKYQNSDWTDWVYWIDATQCGLVSVWSGYVRSTTMAPNSLNNLTNFSTCDSVDNGTSATIRVYGAGGVGTQWYQKIGDTTLGPFPSAALPGYAYGTDYWVYYDDRANQFQVFTSAQYANSLSDGYRFVAKMHTVSAGGGGGTSGGGGTGGGGGGCTEVGTPLYFDRNTDSAEVVLEENADWIEIRFTAAERPLRVHPDTLVGVWVKAKDLKPGDLIDVGDDGEFLPLHSATPTKKSSHKQKVKALRNRKYRAGSRKVELHNLKNSVL